MKIDKRKKYILVLDVETANSTDDALTYDIGCAIADKQGNIYETRSFIINDIFVGEKDLMQSAYYAKKIPKYEERILQGDFIVTNFYKARFNILALMKKYNCTTVAAYNANFDRNALNVTQRWLTKSKYRFYFPYGTEIMCIWHMACQVLYTQKSFIKMARENGFVSEAGNLRTSAEVGFRYMINDYDFEEDHTGLEDVKIEVQIMARCFRQHKPMKTTINRWCWRIPTSKAKELAI